MRDDGLECSLDGGYWESRGNKSSRRRRKQKQKDEPSAHVGSTVKRKKRRRRSRSGNKRLARRRKSGVQKVEKVKEEEVADETQTQDFAHATSDDPPHTSQWTVNNLSQLEGVLKNYKQPGTTLILNINVNTK